MQVKFKSFFITLSFLAAVAMVSCSTSTQVDWTQKNPFSQPLAASELSAGEPLRLVFSSNVLGEVAPCGCPAGPKGGLDRRWNFVQMKLEPESKQRPFLLVDAGNALFASLKLDPARKEAYTRVAEEILKAHQEMGIQVQNVGYMDMSLGPEFVAEAAQSAKLPLVSASWVNDQGKLIYPPFRVVDVGEAKVLVTGLSLGIQPGVIEKVAVRDPALALREVLESHKNHKGPIVVLSDLGMRNDEELAKTFPKQKLIFIGSRDLGGVSIPRQVGRSILLQAEFRGQQWGLLDFRWKEEAESWFFLEERESFAKKWNALVSRRNQDMQALEGEENFKEESLRFDRIAQDLLAYAPEEDASKNIFYDYALHNLDQSYQKRNTLTSKMNFLIDLKD